MEEDGARPGVDERQVDDLRDTARHRGLDERTMQRYSLLGARVDGDHEQAVALVQRPGERLAIAVRADGELGPGEARRAGRIAHREPQRLPSLRDLPGHEPADRAGGAGDRDHARPAYGLEAGSTVASSGLTTTRTGLPTGGGTAVPPGRSTRSRVSTPATEASTSHVTWIWLPMYTAE